MNNKFEVLMDTEPEYFKAPGYSDGTTEPLYRIRAKRNFIAGDNSLVVAGQLGGYVNNEDCLSIDDDSWIFDNAKVFKYGRVSQHATIYDYSEVGYRSRVIGRACLTNFAKLYSGSTVDGHAMIRNCAKVYNNSIVEDHADVHSYGIVCNNSAITEFASISGRAYVKTSHIRDNVCLYGNAIVKNATICGKAQIGDSAEILCDGHYFTVGPIGSRKDFTTFYRDEYEGIHVICGCFEGTIEGFLDAVNKRYKRYCTGDTFPHSMYWNTYIMAASLAVQLIKGYDKLNSMSSIK